MEGIIIILGSPNDARGNLSTIAVERLTQGIKEFSAHPGYALLLTGGFGPHFNTTDKPHAFYARQFVIKAGVPPEEILELVESSNTIEDAVLAKPVVQRCNVPNVIVVTSDFHMERTRAIFERVFKGLSISFSFSSSTTRIGRDVMDSLLEHEKRMMDVLEKEISDLGC